MKWYDPLEKSLGVFAGSLCLLCVIAGVLAALPSIALLAASVGLYLLADRLLDD